VEKALVGVLVGANAFVVESDKCNRATAATTERRVDLMLI
jgi:hypothetical protein